MNNTVLNKIQIKKIKETIISCGLDLSQFNESFDEEICYLYKLDRNYRFLIRRSLLNDPKYIDVFCNPYTYQEHIYKTCQSFKDIVELVQEWATVLKYKIQSKEYYHKIFISHSFKDSGLIYNFIENILINCCGYNKSSILCTSNETTGVPLGEDISKYIKKSIEEASLIFIIISKNYKKSEICLNEMGAAWILEKRIIPILLPNVDFEDLGWLTSFNKAIKIDNAEQLEKLYIMLNRNDYDEMNWNKNKNEFLDKCKYYK